MEKTILITGCSSGIGYCTAHGLQSRGYRVFATARRQESVEMLLAEGLESFQLDLNDSSSIHRAVEEALSRSNGQLYALFNNGGYGLPGAAEDLSRDALRAQFETNFFGWLELTNLILPVMRRQGYGRIIQNSSILGFAAMPFRGAYNASKFAVEGWSDTLRLELRGSGIFVSLIEPGPISTKFRANAMKMFERDIDIENSIHREKYIVVRDRLNKLGPTVPFTLPPGAVLEKVIQVLESNSPKARYYVTFPTHMFGFLKRILPVAVLDSLLAQAGHRHQ